MSVCVLLLGGLIAAGVVSAAEMEWIHQYKPEGSENRQTQSIDLEGNLYSIGSSSNTFPGNSRISVDDADISIRKVDSDGNEIWTHQFGTSVLDQAYAIAVDPSGVYVAGYTKGNFSGLSSASQYDAFICKYDLDGDEVWTRQFGTKAAAVASCIGITETGVYVAGYVTGALSGQTSTGGADAYIRKYDFDGDEVWTLQFGTSGFDQVTEISIEANGIFVRGYTSGTFPDETNKTGWDKFEGKIDDPTHKVSTGDDLTLPKSYALFQNSPNPFNKLTAISFQLKATSHTSLKIYDITGRAVATLVDKELKRGTHTMEWNSDVASGIYFYRLEAQNIALTKKMVLLK
jgi:hypothetical protein